MSELKRAIDAMRAGEIVALYDYDDREGETDLIIAAEFVTPKHIFQLRRDAGGLICVAMDPVASSLLGLPYFVDLLRCAGSSGNGFGAVSSVCERAGDIPYDSKSSFSLWVNHRRTFTGITDIDRALTITGLGEVAKQSLNGSCISLGTEFRSPGHVPLLRAAPNLLKDRKGQTELSIVLARAANVTPVVAVCEMLDGATGRALSKEDAMRYAEMNGLAFVEGKDIEEQC